MLIGLYCINARDGRCKPLECLIPIARVPILRPDYSRGRCLATRSESAMYDQYALNARLTPSKHNELLYMFDGGEQNIFAKPKDSLHA